MDIDVYFNNYRDFGTSPAETDLHTEKRFNNKITTTVISLGITIYYFIRLTPQWLFLIVLFIF